ncbi:MAG: hypothetical protein ACRDE7_12930, partial [Sphingobacterium sp.]
MRKLCVLFAAVALFLSCKKESNPVGTSICASQMKEKFNSELKCIKKNWHQVNLYSGTYKKKQVYFSYTMCINCGTVPPKFGYTCDDEKIDFENFDDVENVKEVYNSCTKEFID